MLVTIVGATGTGKSGLSLDLAEALCDRGQPAEIVNADAMQLYRGMDIGTAKVPVEERRGIPHHMLDVLDPREETSVADYQADARQAIEQIGARGAVPILVGGSGLYVSSVIFDFAFPGTDPAIRQRLEADLRRGGPGLLSRRLQRVDPEAASAIGVHNGRRIVRALEVVELTGKPFGSGMPDADRLWRPTTIVGLTVPRPALVERLAERTRDMWQKGLVEEGRALLGHGFGATAGRAIGYAQAIAEVKGELTEAEAIKQTTALTRKFARRQVSWFTRYPETTWLEHDDSDILETVLSRVARR